jgi:hypothetical protein
LWGAETPGQANDQRDMIILSNKKKVSFFQGLTGGFVSKNFFQKDSLLF